MEHDEQARLSGGTGDGGGGYGVGRLAGTGRGFAADFVQVALRGAAAFFVVVRAGAAFADFFFGALFFAAAFFFVDFAADFFVEEADFFAGFAPPNGVPYRPVDLNQPIGDEKKAS